MAVKSSHSSFFDSLSRQSPRSHASMDFDSLLAQIKIDPPDQLWICNARKRHHLATENCQMMSHQCAPGGARFQRVQVPNPPGSGKDIAEGKGVHREVESEGSWM